MHAIVIVFHALDQTTMNAQLAVIITSCIWKAILVTVLVLMDMQPILVLGLVMYAIYALLARALLPIVHLVVGRDICRIINVN